MDALDLTAGMGRPDRSTEPGNELLTLLNGAWVTQVIRTACVLKLPDRIACGARSVEALAAEAECDVGALSRLLRALVAIGLCESAGESHRLTPMGELLRVDAADSLHHWALHAGGSLWQRFGELPESVRTGLSWPQRHHGEDGYARMSRDVEASAIFHRAMVELTRRSGPVLMPALRVGAAQLVVDVGGGRGELLAMILDRFTGAHGVLMDQATALAGARDVLERAGVADRCRLDAGDFFVAVPEGGDLYLLKSVLHNWDDERCSVILRHCARAMATGGRLLVIERVVPTEPGCSRYHLEAARTDLNMLVGLSGRERTAAEYARLMAQAGLALGEVRETGTEWSVLEARPA